MDQRTLIIFVVVALVIIGIVGFLLIRKRQSGHLKERFGTEYDRLVQQKGDAGKAEAVLAEREKRIEKLSIRALAPADRERYAQEWASVQRRFVDDPALAVNEADKLVATVMTARGYPTSDFEQRAADISVNYPNLVQNYRGSRDIVVRHGKGQAGTEDLRQAMVHYRALFDELLGSPKAETSGGTRGRAS